MLHIRQTAGVQEYADRFTKLVDQLLAYGKNTDPLFYAMKFVDGPRDDIHSAVQMQRPTWVDTAVVLALLQEELVDPFKRRDGRRSVFTAFFEFVCVLIVFLLVCVSSPASSTVAPGLTF